MRPLYDLQGVEIRAPFERAFTYIADPVRLPEWTHAFRSVRDGRAVMRTPAGEVEVGLEISASRPHGTVDWTLRFPDGSVGRAFSRLVELERGRNLFSFVLSAPPAPLE